MDISLQDYQEVVGPGVIEELRVLADRVRDRLQGVVRVGHHAVLGLAAAQVAEILAVAEDALLVTLGEPAAAAVEAVAAIAEEAGHHPVARFDPRDVVPDLLDHAHELMAEHRTRLDGDALVVEVQVGAADGARGDADKRLVGTRQ